MMKKVMLFAVLSAFIFSLTATAMPVQDSNDVKYSITRPYEYPVVPGTSEWLRLETNIDKINACRVPDALVNKMSTDALLETFLTHPLATNIFSFDSYDTGFNVLRNYYDTGINELLQRGDLSEVALEKYSKLNVCKPSIKMTTKDFDDMMTMGLLEVLAAEAELNTEDYRSVSLANSIECKYYEKNKNPGGYGALVDTYYRTLAEKNNAQVFNYDTYVYTPRGTQVLATYITDPEYDKDYQDYRAGILAQKYPNATLLRPASPKYNCHSYAWFSTASTNAYHVWEPQIYMSDSSYAKTLTAQVGARIYYANPGGKDNHSGIVSNVNTVVVTSKWGGDGLYKHDYWDCPYYYYDAQNVISFWIPN